MNEASNCFNPTAKKIGNTFAYCVMLVVSLVGNTFIGIIVYKTKTMRKPINFFIVNMAMSDLLFPIFLFPQILTELYVDSWLISGPLGQTFCKLIPFLVDVSAAVSIQSLVMIAVDRFGAVVFPLRSPLIPSKLCFFFIFASWIIAMATQSPDLFTYKLVEYSGGLVCEMLWAEAFGESSSNVNYLLAIYVVFLYIPLVFIIILYSIIVLKLKLQKIPGEQSANTERHRVKRERNVLKMAIAVVLGFAVCWVPYSIVALVSVYAWNTSCGVMYFLFLARLMAYANCAINPCICLILCGNFRKGLKHLLNCF